MNKTQISNTLNEVRILSSISNKFIVEYKEAFIEQNNEMCIVMEFVGGGDLQAKIQKCLSAKTLMNEKRIWFYMIQTLLGLKVLHENKIIHRDIKSANLFLAEDGKTVKLGDMNIAKIIKDKFASTQIGTPYYLAPEIWNNQKYDFKCDVFSLGVVIYEMTALKYPFNGKTL